MKALAYRLAVVIALAIAGCSTVKPAPIGANPPAPVQPADTSPKPAAAQDSAKIVNTLNDKAFRLLKEGNWQEAAALSREALTHDEASSAAWFNLGKALVASDANMEAVTAFRRASELTGGKNADVEYNLAKALWVAGDAKESMTVLENAVKQFPDDKDFPALADQVHGRDASNPQGQGKWQEDFDGDGKPDTFAMQEENDGKAPKRVRLVVTSAAGHVLYEGALMGSIHSVTVLKMPDGTQLAHIEEDGCASYPQNEFLAYDPTTKHVTAPWGKDDICAAWTYAGDGKFTTFYRLYFPVAGVTERVWEGGTFKNVKSAKVIYSGVDAIRLPELLSDLAASPMEVQGTEHLFQTADLFQQFRDTTANGVWHFKQSGPVQGDTMTLAVTVGQQAHGTVTLTLKQDGDRQTLITKMVWAK